MQIQKTAFNGISLNWIHQDAKMISSWYPYKLYDQWTKDSAYTLNKGRINTVARFN